MNVARFLVYTAFILGFALDATTKSPTGWYWQIGALGVGGGIGWFVALLILGAWDMGLDHLRAKERERFASYLYEHNLIRPPYPYSALEDEEAISDEP